MAYVARYSRKFYITNESESDTSLHLQTISTSQEYHETYYPGNLCRKKKFKVQTVLNQRIYLPLPRIDATLSPKGPITKPIGNLFTTGTLL